LRGSGSAIIVCGWARHDTATYAVAFGKTLMLRLPLEIGLRESSVNEGVHLARERVETMG